MWGAKRWTGHHSLATGPGDKETNYIILRNLGPRSGARRIVQAGLPTSKPGFKRKTHVEYVSLQANFFFDPAI
jgi:hypothetical protein